MALLSLTLVLAARQGSGFLQSFNVSKKSLVSVGRNSFFILEPGYQLVFEGKEDGAQTKLVIDVLQETKVVDGVTTRVVREHEIRAGALVEISKNYFAFDPAKKDVYYFGEDVDMYRNGKVTGHEGSWLSGIKNAHFGLVMPGSPKLHDRYHQEVARGVAMDRAEHVSLTETADTPAGKFKNCLRVEETSPLEPRTKEYKVYAPGVGLVVEGGLKLVRYGVGKPVDR